MDFPAADREFEFTQADFERIRALIQQHAGIALAPVKQDMVYSRLARRLRALGLRRFDEYLQRLQRGDQLEWEAFVNSLTTNLTSFFREAHHFDILARQLKASTQRPFRVWCAASSTGEEAYSLAMTACETFTSLAPPVQIIASDIDTSVLATARAAVYSRDRLDRITEERMRSYFVADPTSGRENYKVRIELQRLITFTRINLLETHWPLQGPLDAIFCRNVMIYFDKPTQYSVLKRFKPLLRSGGLLYAGHSESFLHAADLFKSIGRTVYAPADPGQPEFRVG